MTTISEALAKCASNIRPDDCPNVNQDCILNVTLNCFKTMIDNAAAPALGMQLGGGMPVPFQRIVPYLIAYDLPAQGNTMVPMGLIVEQAPKKKYWTHVKLSRYLNSAQMKQLKAKLKTELKN